MGIHEGAEKVLAIADFCGSAHVRYLDCADTGLGSCAVYLYGVLRVEVMSLVV